MGVGWWPQSTQVQESPYLTPETGPQLAPSASDFVTRREQIERKSSCGSGYPWAMAVTARTLTDEQRQRLLEAHLVKPKVERSPEERAEAVLRVTNGRRLPLRVTKDEYRP